MNLPIVSRVVGFKTPPGPTLLRVEGPNPSRRPWLPLRLHRAGFRRLDAQLQLALSRSSSSSRNKKNMATASSDATRDERIGRLERIRRQQLHADGDADDARCRRAACQTRRRPSGRLRLRRRPSRRLLPFRELAPCLRRRCFARPNAAHGRHAGEHDGNAEHDADELFFRQVRPVAASDSDAMLHDTLNASRFREPGARRGAHASATKEVAELARACSGVWRSSGGARHNRLARRVAPHNTTVAAMPYCRGAAIERRSRRREGDCDGCVFGVPLGHAAAVASFEATLRGRKWCAACASTSRRQRSASCGGRDAAPTRRLRGTGRAARAAAADAQLELAGAGRQQRRSRLGPGRVHVRAGVHVVPQRTARQLAGPGGRLLARVRRGSAAHVAVERLHVGGRP